MSLLTVSDGSICAGRGEQLHRQQSYCFQYPPGCSADEMEGGVETERFIKCVVIKRFVKVTLGLHCETDYVQSQKLNLSLPP